MQSSARPSQFSDPNSEGLVLATPGENAYLYINLACLSVCLSVCLYPINAKTAEPIGPKFLWDITGPQGRFMNNKNF